MATTRERVVLGGILAVAVGGLAVDKLILGGAVTGPQASAAAELLVPHDSSGPPPVPPEQAAMSELSQRIGRLAETSGAPSLDELDETFVRARQAADPQPLARDVDPPAVSAVLVGARPAVVAAGRSVRVGDSIAGWTVVAIDSDAVTFERGGLRVEKQVR